MAAKNYWSIISTALLCVVLVFNFSFAYADGNSTLKWKKIFDPKAFSSITYHDGLYVGVGGDGLIKTSENGTEWTEAESNSHAGLRDVAFGGSRFVAVGSDILTSEDGKTWSPLSPELLLYDVAESVAYNGNAFAVSTQKGYILSSVDGVTWKKSSLGGANAEKITTDGKSLYATTHYSLFKSEDGSHWEAVDTGVDPYKNYVFTEYSHVVYHNGKLMAWGKEGGDRYFSAASTDGVTWETHNTDIPQINTTAISDGNWIFALCSGNLYISKDGIDWEEKPGDYSNFNGLMYLNGRYFMRGFSNELLTSLNGTDWTKVSTNKDTEQGHVEENRFELNDDYNKTPKIATNGQIQVKVGQEVRNDGSSHGDGAFGDHSYCGKVLTSTDGETWEKQVLDEAYGLNAVVYGNNQFVAVGNLGTIVTSVDGVEWRKQEANMPLSSASALYDIIWDGVQFVAAGDGVILYSKDGNSWMHEASPSTSSRIIELLWNDDRYVGITANDSVITAKRLKTFTDIENHWAKNDIISLTEKGIIKGVNPISFEPERGMTRAEFASIIVRAFTLKNSGTQVAINDISKSDWFYENIIIAYQSGILQGYGNQLVHPNKSITREEAMVLIARAMKLTDMGMVDFSGQTDQLLHQYNDNMSISEWARDSVAACVGANIVKGSENNINPSNNITRAEASAIIARLIG